MIPNSSTLLSPPPLVPVYISRTLGWIYTFAWSLSFYPQVFYNHKCKSTVGLSTDFVALNAVGHASYLVYNALLLYYEPVRRAYRHTHGGRDNVVQFNDFVFSLHATLLSLITLAQYLRYKKSSQHISRTVQLSLAAALTAFVFLAGAKRLKLVSWLDMVYAASTLKLAVTLTKYLPQIKLNHDRKTTHGFVIENILLDLVGGLLSLAQLAIDARWIQSSWNGVTGDWGKLGLGLLSIAFDGVLCWQHYVIYAGHKGEVQEHDNDPNTNYGSTASSSARPNEDQANESSSLLR